MAKGKRTGIELTAYDDIFETDRLDVSGCIADYSRKFLSCHSSGFTGFLDSLSYRREIEVKMIVPFVH